MAAVGRSLARAQLAPSNLLSNAEPAHRARSARCGISRVASCRRAVPRRWQRAAAEEGSSPGPAADNEDVTFEPMRKARVKGKLQAKVKVSTPMVDAVLDAPPSEQARGETQAVLALTGVFLAIMVEGLLVAGSGFMSEEWDGFVQVSVACSCAAACFSRAHAVTSCPAHQANVLPIFAPTLGLFLAGSSAYGACKQLV